MIILSSVNIDSFNTVKVAQCNDKVSNEYCRTYSCMHKLDTDGQERISNYQHESVTQSYLFELQDDHCCSSCLPEEHF